MNKVVVKRNEVAAIPTLIKEVMLKEN